MLILVGVLPYSIFQKFHPDKFSRKLRHTSLLRNQRVVFFPQPGLELEDFQLAQVSISGFLLRLVCLFSGSDEPLFCLSPPIIRWLLQRALELRLSDKFPFLRLPLPWQKSHGPQETLAFFHMSFILGDGSSNSIWPLFKVLNLENQYRDRFIRRTTGLAIRY